MPIEDLQIFGQYNVQQFIQFCPEDLANWSLVKNDAAKKGFAFYPTLGRKHIKILNLNILNFLTTPRAIYKSNRYFYVFVDNNLFRYNTSFSRTQLTPPDFSSTVEPIYFTYLVAPSYTLMVFTDGFGMWVHNEDTGAIGRVIDPNLLDNPTAIAAFGNRIIMTGANKAEFRLSKVNLGPLVGQNVDLANCFGGAGNAIFAYETENIVNFGVLHNTLYIFLESSTSIWSNIPSVFGAINGVVVQFPWKKNTTYNFDYGLASPFTLAIDFGRMVWLGKNSDGLTQVVTSSGEQPVPISTKAISVLFERDSVADEVSPFLATDTVGFLYQYQNTVYYRISAGKFFDFDLLDIEDEANSLEYSFDTDSWSRCIEVNGERSRVDRHVYFGGRHLVTLKEDNTIYELSGQFFTNEIRNPDQTDVQASNAYVAQPMRYERITKIISEPDYGEFLTDFVQIDFVWGDKTFSNTTRPFENAIFVITEDGEFVITEDGDFVITEDSNYPVLDSTIYHKWFKPHLELYVSDDGGITYWTADVREFSQLGVYQWRMRWYELGPSRNRVYKLVCVSPSPIVVLGAIMQRRRASGGAA